MKLCSFDGCDKPLHAKGLCDGHYTQFREGRPLQPLRKRARRVPETCTFEGCDRKYDSGGLCSGHAKQRCEGRELAPLIVKAHGDWTLEKLLALTEPDGECMVRCREYSSVRHEGNHVAAHRLAYMLHTGENIEGAHIHHICANARCINPEHLQRASAAENTLEMMARRDYEAEIARLQLRIIELEAKLEMESSCA